MTMHILNIAITKFFIFVSFLCHQIVMTARYLRTRKTERKNQYVLEQQCTLVAIQGPGCVYFVVAYTSHCNSMPLYLTIEMERGGLLVYGQNADTHAVSPRTYIRSAL